MKRRLNHGHIRMDDIFAPDTFKKIFLSYFWKWGIVWGVLMILIVTLIVTLNVVSVESQINSRGITTGRFAFGNVAMGVLTGYGVFGSAVVYAFAILAMSPVQAVGVIAIGGINAFGIIAIGTNAFGIIAIGGNAYGIIAIGPHTWGIYTLSNSEFGKGRYRFSPHHQDEQAVKFFTHFMPKLKSAFSSTHNG